MASDPILTADEVRQACVRPVANPDRVEALTRSHEALRNLAYSYLPGRDGVLPGEDAEPRTWRQSAEALRAERDALTGLAHAAVYYTAQTGWGPVTLQGDRPLCNHCSANMDTEEHRDTCRYGILWAFAEAAMTAMPDLIASMTEPPQLLEAHQ